MVGGTYEMAKGWGWGGAQLFRLHKENTCPIAPAIHQIRFDCVELVLERKAETFRPRSPRSGDTLRHEQKGIPYIMRKTKDTLSAAE